jgi:hypothetical protein
MTTLLNCLLLVVLTAGLFYRTSAVAQLEPGSIAATAIGSLHIEQDGVYYVLEQMSERAHVPVGVDAIQPAKGGTITLDFSGGSVAELMNLFVSKANDYRWVEKSGVINVSRVNAGVSLVDVVIDYPGASGKTRQEIWMDIKSRPEVLAWFRDSGCSEFEYLTGQEFRQHNKPITIQPGKLSLRDLLNEVTTESGSGYWAVLQSAPSESCRVSIMPW